MTQRLKQCVKGGARAASALSFASGALAQAIDRAGNVIEDEGSYSGGLNGAVFVIAGAFVGLLSELFIPNIDTTARIVCGAILGGLLQVLINILN